MDLAKQVKAGEIVMTEEGLLIPEEKYAPYFGRIHANMTSNIPITPTRISRQIAQDHDLWYWNSGNSKWDCNPDRTQQNVDDYE